MELSKATCQAELKKYHFVPRKYHGQVFTTDEKVIGQLIQAIQSIYKPGTRIVEIGGGLGYITQQLIQHFDDVDCLEIDDDLYEILVNKFCLCHPDPEHSRRGRMNKKNVHADLLACHCEQGRVMNKNIIQSPISKNICHSERSRGMNKNFTQKNGLRLIKGDILDYPFSVGAKTFSRQNYILVGNIPFHISGRLYRKFMSEIRHKPIGMVFIADKQYAKTLMGQPPRCYRVSLQAQAYGDIEIVADVPPCSVYPEPKVMSCIMKITQNKTKLPKNFWKVVNFHFENFPTPEVESPKTVGLKGWIELCK